MAGSQQQELALHLPNGERFSEHLQECGVPAVARRLAELVFDKGEWDQERKVRLTISSRQAAGPCKSSDRAVAKAAATLSRFGWFTVVDRGRNKPPLYVLNYPAAASMLTAEQRREEVLADGVGGVASGRGGCQPVRTGANHCEPLRTTANHCEPLRTAARALTESHKQNPCHSFTLPTLGGAGGGGEKFAVVRSGSQAGRPAAGDELPGLPWSYHAGVTDDQLVRAVARGDLRLLRHLYHHAVNMRKFSASDDSWLRFLTGCHHAATARLVRRMGRLFSFICGNAERHVPPLDVSRMKQQSEQWAARAVASQWRAPELARRLVGGEPDGGH